MDVNLSMTTITSLSEFFQSSGFQFRVFDMGRHIRTIAAEDFLAIEQAEQAYPYPMQRQAWIGLLGWPEDDTKKHFVWFLRLPLDETGQLSYVVRDDLLRRLVKMAEQGLNGNDDLALQTSMDDNPFGYKPTDERMAIFHAKARKLLGLTPSKYYQHAHDYFAGQLDIDQWSFVGLQGIADVAARLDEDENALNLADIIDTLPDIPFEVLCQCLENEALDMNLSQAIARRATHELAKQEPHAGQIALCLRALSMSQSPGMRRNMLEHILTSKVATDIQILVGISGRCWEDLEDELILHDFLSALACNPEGQDLFNKVLADLFTLPGMRVNIMTALRNPQRTDQLSAALGQFFASIRQSGI